MFPYTHDTGAVTGTELGVEFYTLPLTEINIAAFQPFNTTLFKTNFNFMFFLKFSDPIYTGLVQYRYCIYWKYVVLAEFS